jgi:alkylation response protein AidB-like acyl-CoA dehydrogenase
MNLSPYDKDQYADIRASVRKLCSAFPGDYWQKLDEVRAYPTEFVHALTEAGFLSVLIPEEYGGSGLGISAAAAVLETIQAEGCNGGACHAQMYTMGTILRHGREEQKRKYCRRSRLANSGSKPLGSRSLPAVRTRQPCAPSPAARAANMSSTAKRSGRAAPSTRT